MISFEFLNLPESVVQTIDTLRASLGVNKSNRREATNSWINLEPALPDKNAFHSSKPSISYLRELRTTELAVM